MTEVRHCRGEAEALVEAVPADARAGVREHVGGALGEPATGRGQAHEREVAGAAADVDDQGELLAGHRALEGQRRRQRRVQEAHVAKPQGLENAREERLRVVALRQLRRAEAHGPADDERARVARPGHVPEHVLEQRPDDVDER